MARASDRFIVFTRESETVRRCPFCDLLVKDAVDRDVNFIVHMGEPSAEHQSRREWADYLTLMNRA